MCHAIHQHARTNNKDMKDRDPNKESSYVTNWHVNNLYGQEMQQKLPMDSLKWINHLFVFNKESIKSYYEGSDILKSTYLKLILKSYTIYTVTCHSYPEECRFI